MSIASFPSLQGTGGSVVAVRIIVDFFPAYPPGSVDVAASLSLSLSLSLTSWVLPPPLCPLELACWDKVGSPEHPNGAQAQCFSSEE